MTITDLTNTAWQFNDNINYCGDGTISHHFNISYTFYYNNYKNRLDGTSLISPEVSHGTSYTISYTLNSKYTIYYLKTTDGTYINAGFTEGEGWYLKNGKASYDWIGKLAKAPLLHIIGGNDVTNPDLISWLQENAILKSGVTTRVLNFENTRLDVKDEPLVDKLGGIPISLNSIAKTGEIGLYKSKLLPTSATGYDGISFPALPDGYNYPKYGKLICHEFMTKDRNPFEIGMYDSGAGSSGYTALYQGLYWCKIYGYIYSSSSNSTVTRCQIVGMDINGRFISESFGITNYSYHPTHSYFASLTIRATGNLGAEYIRHITYALTNEEENN